MMTAVVTSQQQSISGSILLRFATSRPARGEGRSGRRGFLDGQTDGSILVDDVHEDFGTFSLRQPLLVDGQDDISNGQIRVSKQSVLGNVGDGDLSVGILFHLNSRLGGRIVLAHRDAGEASKRRGRVAGMREKGRGRRGGSGRHGRHGIRSLGRCGGVHRDGHGDSNCL